MFEVVLSIKFVVMFLGKLLLRSALPDSILLYLNIFPLAEKKLGQSEQEQEVLRHFDEFVAIPTSFPATCLPDGLFAWIYLRLHMEGLSEDPGARIRHANALVLLAITSLK